MNKVKDCLKIALMLIEGSMYEKNESDAETILNSDKEVQIVIISKLKEKIIGMPILKENNSVDYLIDESTELYKVLNNYVKQLQNRYNGSTTLKINYQMVGSTSNKYPKVVK
jgi:hypothetical protein